MNAKKREPDNPMFSLWLVIHRSRLMKHRAPESDSVGSGKLEWISHELARHPGPAG